MNGLDLAFTILVFNFLFTRCLRYQRLPLEIRLGWKTGYKINNVKLHPICSPNLIAIAHCCCLNLFVSAQYLVAHFSAKYGYYQFFCYFFPLWNCLLSSFDVSILLFTFSYCTVAPNQAGTSLTHTSLWSAHLLPESLPTACGKFFSIITHCWYVKSFLHMFTRFVACIVFKKQILQFG